MAAQAIASDSLGHVRHKSTAAGRSSWLGPTRRSGSTSRPPCHTRNVEAAPHGTVTFLFTDVEGSTRLWEEFPDAMQAALASHDATVRSVIEEHGGYVFSTAGDAFSAAFWTPGDALAAAVEAQRLVAGLPFAGVELRVRMGLHHAPLGRRRPARQQELRDYGPPL